MKGLLTMSHDNLPWIMLWRHFNCNQQVKMIEKISPIFQLHHLNWSSWCLQIVVLHTKTAKAATPDILTMHCIPSAMSDDLKSWWLMRGVLQSPRKIHHQPACSSEFLLSVRIVVACTSRREPLLAEASLMCQEPMQIACMQSLPTLDDGMGCFFFSSFVLWSCYILFLSCNWVQGTCTGSS